MSTEERINLYDQSPQALEALLHGWGLPAYRARQLYRQLYVNYARDPQAMTDLPQPLRQRLAQESTVGRLEQVQVQVADGGQTRKALFRLSDGAVIESVLMVYPGRATVCVSTQAGCAMGCVFCATGRMGLLRNLSPGDIIEQVLWAARELRATGGDGQAAAPRPAAPDSDGIIWWGEDNGGKPQASNLKPLATHLTNIVFMGMGEPFANYDRWWQAVERLHDPQGFNMGARGMTVSTVGLPPGIRRLADAGLPVNLAISLHAPDDALRSELMPVNNRYPIAALLDATREYIAKTRRRVSFEYVLLQGRNDAPEHAAALAELLDGMLCHVNLIPWNPVPGMPLTRSHQERVREFQRILQERVPCTVRQERGVAIAAACGQLAAIPLTPTSAPASS
ncbi:MAG TPA: 23S rRNA (adenine(2503)-C2)-methyltransferase [Roseiflexaceae bacterium]|nr:23S rRNA (adenine(2503)-C2)-methyltransferase [Roseiflexaceae bacterium]